MKLQPTRYETGFDIEARADHKAYPSNAIFMLMLRVTMKDGQPVVGDDGKPVYEWVAAVKLANVSGAEISVVGPNAASAKAALADILRKMALTVDSGEL